MEKTYQLTIEFHAVLDLFLNFRTNKTK